MERKTAKKRDVTTNNHHSSIINHQSKELLSEEKLDFLREMMNIGAGNASTALAQMLQSEVRVEIPKVENLHISEIDSLIEDPTVPVECVRMRLVGNVTGDMFFIVPDEKKDQLIQLAEKAMQQPAQSTSDLSVLAELGNILSGVYLTAIHDFCRLDIYHSVPTVVIDMIQSVIDESIINHCRKCEAIIVIENKFLAEKSAIESLLLLIPDVQSVNILANSIDQAIKVMKEER